MFVLYVVMMIIFRPQFAEAVAWLRWLRARRAIQLKARAAAVDLDLEYELLLHTHR